MEKKLYYISTNANDCVVSECDGEYRVLNASVYCKLLCYCDFDYYEDYKKAAYEFLNAVEDDSGWDEISEEEFCDIMEICEDYDSNEMEIVATAFVNI